MSIVTDGSRQETLSTELAKRPSVPRRDWQGALPDKRWLFILALAWVACALYARTTLTHGWVPHDPGALGQSAERVLQGQLPHRDFDEIYTGGLSYLYAGTFLLLGPSILSMRLVLYAVFVFWLPAMYYVARHVATREAALLAVLLCAMWSIPVYPAAIPSWYNLFFASFGIAATFRYLDTDRRRWLFIAGICGGLSCLVKIIGMYYVAAVLLFMLYREQDLSRQIVPMRERHGAVLITLCLGVFNMILAGMVSRFGSFSFEIYFVLPTFLLSAVLLWREWRTPHLTLTSRFRELTRMLAPFLAGVIAPLTLFVIPYVVSGSVHAFMNGVFVRPARRLDFAALALNDGTIVVLFAGMALAGRTLWRRASAETRLHSAIVLGLSVIAASFATSYVVIYRLFWLAMRAIVPLVTIWGAWRLTSPAAMRDRGGKQPLFLLLTAAALCSLVQFPFDAAVYFFYVAPLAVLAALALFWGGDPAVRPAAWGLAIAYIAFSLLRIHSASIGTMAHEYVRDDQTAFLALARGGVRVTPTARSQYETLIPVVLAHARSQYTYATPDCPEVYFLSGLRNPTRTIFDFFDDSKDRTNRIMRELKKHDVHVVSLNLKPQFSGPVPQDLESALEARFPQHTRIGNFIVRWRD